jgi:hypothetical protein
MLAFGLLLSVIPMVLSSPSEAQIGIGIGISVRIGPPAVPVYEQPICPSAGYLWTPGYWAWSDDDGYYWVPGTWVEAPTPGLLWTPGYWGWNDGVYAWNGGYWGPHVGFYGGINYGFGYGGVGFGGGEWRDGSFFYNTAVMNVNTTSITSVYVNKTVIVNNQSHVAFNGGQGGVQARPTAQEETYSHEHHTPPVATQVQHEHAASQNRENFASANHGRPAIAATAKPGEFKGPGVIRAKAAGAPYHAPKLSPKEARAPAAGGNRPATANKSGNRPAERPSPAEHGKNSGTKSSGGNRPSKPAQQEHASKPAPQEHAAKPAPQQHASKPAPQEHAAKPAPQQHASKPAPQEHASKPAPQEHAAKPAPAPKHESAPPKSAPKQPKPENPGKGL